MPKLIKTTDDLPKEFNLDNYKDLDKKSAVFWHHAIHKRLMLFAYLNFDIEEFSGWIGLDSASSSKDPITEPEFQNIKKIAITTTLQDPLSNNLIFDFYRENRTVEEIEIYSDKYTGYFKKHLPVSDFNMEKYDFIDHVMGKFINPKAIKNADKSLSVQDFLYQQMKFYLYETECPICINPFYPDNVIFEELKKKLDELRQKFRIDNRKPVERKDLIAWASYGLLPFFDLKLWELYYNYKITRSVMAVTLYPKGQYGEDTIRKSVEPLYFEFITGDVFDGGFDYLKGNKTLPLMDSLTRLAYAESGKEFT